MPSCFVTGATGFVGGHLCEALQLRGWNVYALSRKSSKRSVLEACGVEIIEGSLEDPSSFAVRAAQCDVVFHLAAVTRGLCRDDFFRINADGAEKLAKALAGAGFAGRLVHLSSLAAGGPALFGKARNEETPEAPVSHYGRSKHAAEKRIDRVAQDKFAVIHLRPGAIYGPREHEIHEILKSLAKTRIALRAGGELQVQLIHVADVVSALIAAAEAPTIINGQRLCIIEREIHSFSGILRAAAKELGFRPWIIPVPLFGAKVVARLVDAAGRIAGKPLSPLGRDKVRELQARRWVADPSLAEKTLGWKATIPLKRGLPETITWYRENGWL